MIEVLKDILLALVHFDAIAVIGKSLEDQTEQAIPF